MAKKTPKRLHLNATFQRLKSAAYRTLIREVPSPTTVQDGSATSDTDLETDSDSDYPESDSDSGIDDEGFDRWNLPEYVVSIKSNADSEIDYSRLLSLPSEGHKWECYIIPQCNHDDLSYPHNKIKETDSKLRCISRTHARNICMAYRMRLMLSGNTEWAQAKTSNYINVWCFAAQVNLYLAHFIKRHPTWFTNVLSEDDPLKEPVEALKSLNHLGADSANDDYYDLEKEFTPQQRGYVFQELIEKESFEAEPSQGYGLLGQILSVGSPLLGQFLPGAQAEDSEGNDENEGLDLYSAIIGLDEIIDRVTRIKAAYREILDQLRTKPEAKVPAIGRLCEVTASVDEDLRRASDCVDVGVKFALQPRAKLDIYAADGTHSAFMGREDDTIYLLLHFSEEGAEKLAGHGIITRGPRQLAGPVGGLVYFSGEDPFRGYKQCGLGRTK